MTRVELDDNVLEKLPADDDVVEVCDSHGKIVGHLLPPGMFHRFLYRWAREQVSDDDLERARKDPESYTTDELLEYLKGL